MDFKSKKGSILIFILIALLFMTSYLIIAYASNVNKTKTIKEQYEIINEIYSGYDSDEEKYNSAYTAIRKKNKQILKQEVENISIIELEKTFEDSLSNYTIYGNINGVGELVTDTSNENYGKYLISIKVTDKNGDSKEEKIYLNETLGLKDYIDFKTGKIYKSDETNESILLPQISTYEDYTQIEVLSNYIPAKIILEYTGYTLD